MRFYDAFGGIGGFRIGMERNNHTCVGYCDIDIHAVAIYNYNFGENNEPTDIRFMDTTTLPDFDCLCGGFPCPTFSRAGNRKGLDDERGQLFFELSRILRDKRPNYFIFENVGDILTHNGGKTFTKILATLGELGYIVTWQVCDSRNFGTPQRRKRVYLIGFPSTTDPGTIYPLIQRERIHLAKNGCCTEIEKRFRSGDCISTITRNYRKGVHCGGETYVNLSTDDQVVFTKENDVIDIDPNSIIIRRLTPLECERLQTFPDNWTLNGKYNYETKLVADVNRYAVIGNAVTVNVVDTLVNHYFKNR